MESRVGSEERMARWRYVMCRIAKMIVLMLVLVVGCKDWKRKERNARYSKDKGKCNRQLALEWHEEACEEGHGEREQDELGCDVESDDELPSCQLHHGYYLHFSKDKTYEILALSS